MLWPKSFEILHLVHGSDKVVNVRLPIAVLSSLNEVQALLVQATVGGVELEGPQKVVGFLESWADCIDLMDQVLNADDVMLSKILHTENRQSQTTS